MVKGSAKGTVDLDLSGLLQQAEQLQKEFRAILKGTQKLESGLADLMEPGEDFQKTMDQATKKLAQINKLMNLAFGSDKLKKQEKVLRDISKNMQDQAKSSKELRKERDKVASSEPKTLGGRIKKLRKIEELQKKILSLYEEEGKKGIILSDQQGRILKAVRERKAAEKEQVRRADEELGIIKKVSVLQEEIARREKESPLAGEEDLENIKHRVRLQKQLIKQAEEGKRDRSFMAREQEKLNRLKVRERHAAKKITDEEKERIGILKKQKTIKEKAKDIDDLLWQKAFSVNKGLMAIQARLMLTYKGFQLVQDAVTATARELILFDEALRDVQAIAGLTDRELQDLTSTVKIISRETKFTGVEVAEAAKILAQAGYELQQISSLLEAVTLTAAAVGSSPAEAVDAVTTALEVFNKTAEEGANVSDRFVTAINEKKLSMQRIRSGLQYAGNVAGEMNITLEESLSLFGAMAQAGIKTASMYGTGFRALLTKLAAPTEKAIAVFRRLGLTTADLNVETRGIIPVLKDLRDAGLSTADAMQVFERRGGAAFLAISRNLDTADALRNSFTETGSAAVAADKQMQSLANSGRKAFAAFTNLANTQFDGAISKLARMTTWLGEIAEQTDDILRNIGRAHSGSAPLSEQISTRGKELEQVQQQTKSLANLLTSALVRSPELETNPEERETFVRSAVASMQKLGYDVSIRTQSFNTLIQDLQKIIQSTSKEQIDAVNRLKDAQDEAMEEALSDLKTSVFTGQDSSSGVISLAGPNTLEGRLGNILRSDSSLEEIEDMLTDFVNRFGEQLDVSLLKAINRVLSVPRDIVQAEGISRRERVRGEAFSPENVNAFKDLILEYNKLLGTNTSMENLFGADNPWEAFRESALMFYESLEDDTSQIAIEIQKRITATEKEFQARAKRFLSKNEETAERSQFALDKSEKLLIRATQSQMERHKKLLERTVTLRERLARAERDKALAEIRMSYEDESVIREKSETIHERYGMLTKELEIMSDNQRAKIQEVEAKLNSFFNSTQAMFEEGEHLVEQTLNNLQQKNTRLQAQIEQIEARKQLTFASGDTAYGFNVAEDIAKSQAKLFMQMQGIFQRQLSETRSALSGVYTPEREQQLRGEYLGAAQAEETLRSAGPSGPGAFDQNIKAVQARKKEAEVKLNEFQKERNQLLLQEIQARTQLLQLQEQEQQNLILEEDSLEIKRNSVRILNKWTKEEKHRLSASKIANEVMAEGLSSAHNEMQGFVSTVTSGAKSVKDAFKDMGMGILKSMHQTASDIAGTAIMNLLVSVGTSMLSPGGGGGGAGDNTPRSITWGKGRARGGLVEGGDVGRDSVLTPTRPGEYVVQKNAVNILGKSAMDKLNKGILPTSPVGIPVNQKGNSGDIVNVWVVSEDQQPAMGPNDVVAVIGENIRNNGPIKKLIKTVQTGG